MIFVPLDNLTLRFQWSLFSRTQGVTKLENATDAYVPIVWFEDGIEELDDPETINLLRSAVLQPALIHAILYPTLFAVGFLVLLVSLGCLIKWRKDWNNDKQVLSSNIAMISTPIKLLQENRCGEIINAQNHWCKSRICLEFGWNCWKSLKEQDSTNKQIPKLLRYSTCYVNFTLNA